MSPQPTQSLRGFYLPTNEGHEYCFYVQPNGDLDSAALERLKWMLGGGALGAARLQVHSGLKGAVREIGPKGAMIPPASTNLARAMREAGIPVRMIKQSRRIAVNDGTPVTLDRMLEQLYEAPLTSFDSGDKPRATYSIPFMRNGMSALVGLNEKMGFGWGSQELAAIEQLCLALGRDPTILELVGIAQATSEHCSHGFFNAEMVLDGISMGGATLFQMVKEPLSLLPAEDRARCVIAFSDNAAAIRIGGTTHMLYTAEPGQPSGYVYGSERVLATLKVETHNHPSMIRPYPGAATGVGGCIRDILAVGRGGVPAGILVTIMAGRLNFSDYEMPGEKTGKSGTGKWRYSQRYASALDQFTSGMQGAAHYGNASGIPTLMYHPDSIGIVDPNGNRREFIKPVVAAGLLGLLADQHAQKHEQEKGMLVIAMGGEAFNVGFNGGAGSSDPTGTATPDQDQGSVQRGNPFEQHGIQEVFAQCMALGDQNPILCAHDQGAGGFSVVGFEIGDKGVKYELRKVKVGDASMSAVEIFCCEYQERVFVLVRPDSLHLLERLCGRESVNLEILGEITMDGRFVVTDSDDGSTPVDLPIKGVKVVSRKKVYEDTTIPRPPTPFKLPELSARQMMELVLMLRSVGSVKDGMNTMDSWVGGKTVVNQRVGPLQLTVSQYAASAADYTGYAGHAVAQSSQPLAMLLDEGRAARLTLATALGNLAFVPIEGGIGGVYGSVNWCWDAKQPGETVRMYNAMRSVKDACINLKGATPHCGKDSVSLGVTMDGRRVKSPGVCLITLHCAVSDIRKPVTADIKLPGRSKLGWLNLSGGEFRLGGSGYAHACDSVGDECPDVDMELYGRGLAAMQELVDKKLILSGHNTSECGLAVSMVKMAMAGNAGIDVEIRGDERTLFAHEAGFVFEFLPNRHDLIETVLRKHNVFSNCFYDIGVTTMAADAAANMIVIGFRSTVSHENCINMLTHVACDCYEKTSDRIEREQLPKAISNAQENDPYRFMTPKCVIMLPPTSPGHFLEANRPRVAILRASGSNGHPEMAAMCMRAGMTPVDVHINDLCKGTCGLSQFEGVFLVGGFADGDAGGSAVGMAGRMLFNERAYRELRRFLSKERKVFHGVCNGNQGGILLGLVPGEAFMQKNASANFNMVMGHNDSGRFEARVVYVRVEDSPAIMYRHMVGSILPSIAAHGEGKFTFADSNALPAIEKAGLVALRYCLPNGELARGRYPWNPNGSPGDIAGLTDETGQVLLTMPHAERITRPETMPWMPPNGGLSGLIESPWLPMFENAAKYLRAPRT